MVPATKDVDLLLREVDLVSRTLSVILLAKDLIWVGFPNLLEYLLLSSD